jgi:hypothetical protein
VHVWAPDGLTVNVPVVLTLPFGSLTSKFTVQADDPLVIERSKLVLPPLMTVIEEGMMTDEHEPV